MKHFLSLTLTFVILLLSMMTLSSCQDPFTVYSCGSGFYFNRSNSKEYTIKELAVTSKGNSFYLDEYFYSRELGDEYTLKLGTFKKEKIYLAKKADYYNSNVYEFNLDKYENDLLIITPEMSYVHIYSSNPDAVHFVYIEIEERTLPVDIILENVNINTLIRLPVIFSKSLSDVNIIVKGTNTLTAGKHEYTQEAFQEYLNKKISNAESYFYNSVGTLYNKIEQFPVGAEEKGLADHLTDELLAIGESSYALFEDIMLGGMQILGGSKGSNGIDGISTIMHLGGISISGDGILNIKGGDGARGADAADSLFGLSDGGDGGKGGAGIYCGNFMATSTVNLNVSGGNGGSGGAPSNSGFGIFGSSGNYGHSGLNGRQYNIANPRED